MRKTYPLLAIFIAASLLLGACAQATSTPALAPGSVQVNGAGATFPQPLYADWIYAYQYVDPSVTINYQGIGSGGGKNGILQNTIDFAGSDSLLSADQYTQGKDLQMFPMVAGAVVPIYNISAITTTLVLDRNTLVGIYSGTITKWNDSAIVALNPPLANKLPDANITVVHRSDGSGTTETFTKALASFSNDWKTNVGAGQSVQWPVDKKGNGVGGKGNQGVAAAVLNTPNSIGYVELVYAVQNKIAFASMVNKAGKTVTANAKSLAAAVTDFTNAFDANLTVTIVDAPGQDSWPISAYTYLILHTQMQLQNAQDCIKFVKLSNFIKWALTDPTAGKRANDLGFNVLPDAVRQQVLAKLGTVTCNGNPVLK